MPTAGRRWQVHATLAPAPPHRGACASLGGRAGRAGAAAAGELSQLAVRSGRLLVAAVLAEICLCSVCSCQGILRLDPTGAGICGALLLQPLLAHHAKAVVLRIQQTVAEAQAPTGLRSADVALRGGRAQVRKPLRATSVLYRCD
jgi:hypothetical protein